MNRGKIIIILYMVLLSIQIVSADTLNLTTSTNETFADNRTAQITANLTNATGYPINNTRVNFTTDCGILSAGYNYTNASGIAVVNISSWDLCTANITAQAPNAANATVNISFVRGPISQIVLSTNSSGTVNTTHLVTATVYDSRLRLMPNVPLNFTITPPPTTYNSASIAPSINTTGESGYTTATARIDKRAGTNHIYVNVTNEDGVMVAEDTAIVGLAGEATNITVTASPVNVSANGIDLSHVTGKVTDEFGNPLLSTGAIRFNITDSDPIIKPLNSVGEATISIGPSKFTGSVAVNGTYINVTGDYTNLTDSATVIFYAEEPARVVVRADATKISTSNISGVNISTITATVIDKWGHTLPGRTVDFILVGPGTLSSATGTTNSHGQVTITLQSAISGDSTVTAKVLNDSGYEIEGSIAIQIMDKPFVSVITTIEPDPVEPGGIINVTTSVSGQGNITGIYLAAHAMLTLDRSGSMDPDYYAGTPLDVVLVIDNSGSMSGTKIEDAKMAAKTFVSRLSSVNRVAIYAFDGTDLESPKMYLNWVLLNSSQNRTLVNDTIDNLSANCWTPIWDTIGVACVKAGYHRSYAIPVVVALTDGDDSGTDGREKGSEDYAPWHDWGTSEWIGTITRYYDGSDHSISINETRNGLLNAPCLIYTIGLNVSPHNTGYENGNNDPGNWTGDYLKTTEYDLWSVSRTSDWNNKHGRYYYAPNSSELSEIYNNIAQEISDYDITEISYGYDGFTPYNYGVQDTIPGSGTWTDNFTINETINDLKIELEWSGSDLNLSLTSPGSHVYGAGGDTTGYTGAGSNPEYIWINPLSGQYPQSDMDYVEPGNWTITVSGTSGQAFNISSYIDKKSAAQIASHAFISSLDPTREDRVGLATYSYSSTNETSTQESYVCQGNQWEGYFTVDSYAIHYFDLSWADASYLDLHLYDGITLLNSSATGSNPEMVSAALSPGTNYRIVVNGTNVIGNDTQFAINVYSTTETVNSGTAAVPLESTTVDIPPVDLNKTFLIVKSSDNHDLESNAHAFTIRGHFIDNDTIEFTRESISDEGEVSYFIIQADNIEVQSGTEAFAKGVIQRDVSITPVTDHTTKCFVALSTSSNGDSRKYVHESWVTGELIANDTLTLKRGDGKFWATTVDWFVIRFTDNTTVQTGETSWSGPSTTTQTIASINTSNTWLYFTSRMGDNGLAHTSIKGEITDSELLTFSKHSDSTTGTDVRYFVIEFPDDSGATVQSGTASASSGDLTVDIGITPVNRKRALAFVTNDCEGTGTAYAMSYWISYFTADNNLKMQRWYTGEPVVHKWQVVEWPEGTSVGIADTPVNWLEWRAEINNSLTDSIVSFDPINDSIDNLTADGMTAIDEGLYEANNALYDYFAAVSKPIENGTIILMTDGIDNVGYHSMIAEAERAAANNTTIFTVGFGSDIDDGVLRQIANITGGEYHFAPNATVLKNVFVGIAGELGNFTAPEPKIAIRLGNNAIVEGVLANVTYINDSANVTYFNCTLADCSKGQYESEYLNPNITYEGDRTILSWDIGNRPDRIITIGKYWTVTYQLRIDNASAGYVPIILYPSCVTYEGAGGDGDCSNNLVPDANVDVVGKPDPSPNPAKYIELTNKSVSGGPPFRTSPKPDTVQEYAYRLTAYLKDADNDPVVELGAVVEFKSTSGTLYNYTHHNTSGLLNETIGLGGAATVWLSSDVPGTITVCAYHTANGTELTPAYNVVIFHSLESPPIIPPAPRPRGVITLESDPFMTDWLSLIWRNR